MSDEKLVEAARTFLGDGEHVEAAGIFQPRGTTGAMEGSFGAGLATDNIVGELAGAAASVEAGKAMSHVDDVPRWTMLAVTPTTVHAIRCGQHGVGWQPEAEFATFDRSRISVAVHARVNVRTVTIEDPDTGRRFEWEGNRIGPAHAKDVIELLEAGPGRPGETPPSDSAQEDER